jgi:hypothetical protein
MSAFMRFALRTSVALLAVVLLGPALAAYSQSATAAPAPALQPIALPAPQMTGGMPLMQALANRQTVRTFRDQALSPQQLSNLLWAAFGINRKEMAVNRPAAPPAPGGPAAPGAQSAPPRPAAPAAPKPGRTAPSGGNRQDIQIYAVLPSGAYLYDYVQNQLRPVSSGDVRAQVVSGAAAKAAVTIVFVAPAKDDPFAQVDTGFIGQNIYLWAASEGLNAWFYTMHGAPAVTAVSTALNLDADHAPLYLESVGYPEK